jgi:hypothetical protein
VGFLEIFFAVATGVIGSLVAAEVFLASPSIARLLVRKSAERLPPDFRERYEAEWLQMLEEIASPSIRLFSAVSIWIKAPRIAWDLRSSNIAFFELCFLRALDTIVGIVFLWLTLPVIAAACLFLRLARSGPIFCNDPFIGMDGKEIRLIRLNITKSGRSPALLWRLRQNRGISKEEYRAEFSRLDRYLRISRVYELTYIVNVIKGDLSIVGPPPLTEKSSAEHCRQRPGIMSADEWRTEWRESVRFISRSVKLPARGARALCRWFHSKWSRK